ncbi:MAG: ATP phosphoribosyltransferase [Formosa sp. Hel3_A1_48]|nr:MAG: ATP phosphoribosyltransferase [Formosa sp. Hel3_A1_48]
MKTLKIAVQKSGRLKGDSLKLLKDIGISIDNGKEQLKARATNFPIEVFYLRNGDIPQYLKDGVVDIAIIGSNILVEKGEGITSDLKLGFSRCRVSLAVPKTMNYNNINDLNGKKIATSYPNTVQAFLNENGINAELHIINGSVEIAPNIGLADAIVDIVSTGGTLFKNNLEEKEVLLTSEAVLAVSPKIEVVQTELLEKIKFRIQSVLKGRSSKYVLLNAPNDSLERIVELLPGMKSPTVLPLAKSGWSSVHSVINQHQFWDIIDDLKRYGAEGILICPIEKMVV